MTAAETGFVEIDGRKIHYSVRGDGPPLVFVHGWTLNLGYWEAQVAHFASRYRTYCYDWRGMGRSTGGSPRFSMDALGAELGGFIAAMGLAAPVVCGHSEGGAIAVQYAATHPDAIRALILADTDLNDVREAAIGAIRVSLTAFFARLQVRAGKNPLVGMMPNLQQQLYSPAFLAAQPAFIRGWQEQFLSNSVPAVVNGLWAWQWRRDVSRLLRQVRAPALLLWGREDRMIRLDEMQRLQRAFGGPSQLTTLAGAGHMSPVEVPEQFNRVVDAFLAQYAGPGAAAGAPTILSLPAEPGTPSPLPAPTGGATAA